MGLRRKIVVTLCLVLSMAAATVLATSHESGGADQNSRKLTEDKKNNADKLSDESVMFGNQQNKPTAGMIDDALAKSFHHDEMIDDEKQEAEQRTPFHEEKRSPVVVSESGVEGESGEDDGGRFSDRFNDPGPYSMYQDKKAEYMVHVGNENVPGEELRRNIEDAWDSENEDFPANNFRRFRRNARNNHHRRNIRASIDQLLDKRNERMKRGLNAFADDNIMETLHGYKRPSLGLDETWDEQEDGDDTFDDNAEDAMAEHNRRFDFNNMPRDWYEMMMERQMPQTDRDDERDLEAALTPGMDLSQHGFQPPYDYRLTEDEADTGSPNNWDGYQDRFFKRRLQESNEDDNENGDEDDFTPFNGDDSVMPDGTNIDDIYQRLIW